MSADVPDPNHWSTWNPDAPASCHLPTLPDGRLDLTTDAPLDPANPYLELFAQEDMRVHRVEPPGVLP